MFDKNHLLAQEMNELFSLAKKLISDPAEIIKYQIPFHFLLFFFILLKNKKKIIQKQNRILLFPPFLIFDVSSFTVANQLT